MVLTFRGPDEDGGFPFHGFANSQDMHKQALKEPVHATSKKM